MGQVKRSNSGMSWPRFLLGIDLGTTSVKAAVLNLQGKLMSLAAVEYTIDSPRQGWAEQSPETWFQATAQAVQQCLTQSDISPQTIAGVGLSGQMHGCVCLDATGATLRPAIIWADQRSHPQVNRIYQEIGIDQLGRWTANPLATGFMLASWLWLVENEPENAGATAYLLLPKDYLRFRLTGRIGSEPSDASSTLLFDTAHRRWSQELLAALEIPLGILPEIFPSYQVTGGLTDLAASACGLTPGTPVVFGASDQACQAIGQGVLEPGWMSCTIGTGGQLFFPSLIPSYDPGLRIHLFCHAIPDRWHLEAAILSAGLSLKWLRDNILEGYTYQQLADLASQIPANSEGLFFLPYLVGERTPHMDPHARGGFIGLTLRHNRSHLVRAVMEGVVFALKQGIALAESLGIAVDHIIASGGATHHPLWLQLQADIYNQSIYQTTTVEASAAGAAILAGVGVGIFTDVISACHNMVRIRNEITQPDPDMVAIYQKAYASFIKLYPAITNTLV
jgi:xylulokinase